MANIEGILSADLSLLQQMSRKDLAKNVSILASAANKRIVRLEKSGVYSPALEYIKGQGGKFSVAGKTKNQLLIEYNRAAEFLTAKTSTVRGAKQWKRNIWREIAKTTASSKRGQQENYKKIESVFSQNPDLEQTFWDVYDRLYNQYEVKELYKEIWGNMERTIVKNPEITKDSLYRRMNRITKKLIQDKARSEQLPSDILLNET